MNERGNLYWDDAFAIEYQKLAAAAITIFEDAIRLEWLTGSKLADSRATGRGHVLQFQAFEAP